MHRSARALAHREKQHRRRRHFHLLVIARAFEGLTSGDQRGIQLFRALDGRTIDGRGNAMKFRVRCIQKNHAPGSKQARIKPRESRAQRLPGTIRLAQELRRLGISQQRCGLFHNRQDLLAQTHVAYRRARNSVAGSRERPQKTVGAG